MDGRRYGDGLHQAIEAKENLKFKKKIKQLRQLLIKIFLELMKS